MHNYEVTISGRKIPVVVNKQRRYKRCSLRVNEQEVRVTVPFFYSDTHWKKFIDQNSTWILKNFIRQQSRIENMPKLADNGKIPFKGEFFPVVMVDPLKQHDVIFKSGTFYLPDKPEIKNILSKWYISQAVGILENLMEIWQENHGKGLTDIKLKNMRSRWGSCTSTGKVSLNWRLIMAAETVFEYVFIHELCHLKVRSHGAEFWELVGQEIPNFNKHRLWLRKHGYMLTNFPEPVTSSSTVASIKL